MVVWQPATVFPLQQNIVTATGTSLGTSTMLIPTDAKTQYEPGGQLTFTMKIKTTALFSSPQLISYWLQINSIVITIKDNTGNFTNAPLVPPTETVSTSASAINVPKEMISTIPVSVLIPSYYTGDSLHINVYVGYRWSGFYSDSDGVSHPFSDVSQTNLRIFLGEPFANLYVAPPPPLPPAEQPSTWTITIEGNGVGSLSGVELDIGTSTGLTDSLGKYTFTNLTAGAYSLTISKTGYLTQTIVKTLDAGKSVRTTVTLQATSSTDDGGDDGTGDGDGGGGGNEDTSFDWMPTLIMGALGVVGFLMSAIGYSIRGSPAYLIFGFCILIICLAVGFMLSTGMISFDSGAIINMKLEALKWNQ